MADTATPLPTFPPRLGVPAAVVCGLRKSAVARFRDIRVIVEKIHMDPASAECLDENFVSKIGWQFENRCILGLNLSSA